MYLRVKYSSEKHTLKEHSDIVLFVAIPPMMNMMPAVRLILALVVSAMLVIERQVRENIDITAPRTPSTTPTIIRARTAWKVPIGQEIDIMLSLILLTPTKSSTLHNILHHKETKKCS